MNRMEMRGCEKEEGGREGREMVATLERDRQREGRGKGQKLRDA